MRRRVIRHQLRHWFDPGVVFSTLYGESDRAFWLDTGVTAQTGFSYLGEGNRVVTASAATAALVWDPPEPVQRGSTDIFEFLAERQAEGVGWADDREGGFQLGWVGWFGYELRARTMGTPLSGNRFLPRYPEAAWLEVLRAVEFDHVARTVTLVTMPRSPRN